LRAVLDPNIIISALLSPLGSPARVVRAFVDGEFELIVSPALLAELERALAYPKLRKRIPPQDAEAVVDWLRRTATQASDPGGEPSVRSDDPGDDYLLVLAEHQRAALVSGDDHLLSLRGRAAVFSTVDFLAVLDERR
jgi:hypothetical protein